MELKDYKRIFRLTDEAGQLDNLSRRFSWFRRILALHEDEHANVFPPSWNVGKTLCAKFTEITAWASFLLFWTVLNIRAVKMSTHCSVGSDRNLQSVSYWRIYSMHSSSRHLSTGNMLLGYVFPWIFWYNTYRFPASGRSKLDFKKHSNSQYLLCVWKVYGRFRWCPGQVCINNHSQWII